jgi:Patatin-like phospholipase
MRTSRGRLGKGATPIVALVLLILQGCAGTSRSDAVPSSLAEDASVPGFTNQIRYFARSAAHVELLRQDFVDSWKREETYLRSQGLQGPLPPAAYLAISGGGDDGAFGAGFLNGWTKAGTRPQFKLVTGISTGALIAPFAFLGSSYDEKLKGIYTGISFKNVGVRRFILAVLFQDAAVDNGPLRKLVKENVTQEMVEAIAAEHAKGRILLIGTTNLDARRPVIWNITAIAASGRPEALELIRQLLIASAAIPGTFPPEMIDVEAEHRKFQEMHVDGGTSAQVFIYPPAVGLKQLSQEAGAERERTLYIIRNARLDPEWAQVDRRTLTIAFRAISSLIQYQGIGDLYRIYNTTRKDGVGFNLAFIPSTFKTPHKTDFDTPYMRALYDTGYRLASEGYAWYKEPPILLSGSEDAPPPPP